MRQLVVILVLLGIGNLCVSQQQFYIFDTKYVNVDSHLKYDKIELKIDSGSYEVYYDSLFNHILETGRYYHGKKIGKIITYYMNGTIYCYETLDSTGRRNGNNFSKVYVDSSNHCYPINDLFDNNGKISPFIADSTYLNLNYVNDTVVDIVNPKVKLGPYYNNNMPGGMFVSDGLAVKEIDFYKSGITRRIISYYDSPFDLHGYQVEFYPNGQKKMESCYNNKFAKGAEAENLMNKDCNLCRDSMFVGPVLCIDTIPTDGVLPYCNILENRWYEDGTKKSEWIKNSKDGEVSYTDKYYYPNGRLWIVANYSSNYKKHGLRVTYYEDGTMQSEKLFDNDVLIKY